MKNSIEIIAFASKTVLQRAEEDEMTIFSGGF